jgi:acetylornithine aminotransferase
MKPFDVYTIFDIPITRALGSTLWDESGNQYLDLYGGHAVISIGHSHPHYVKGVTKQLEKIGFYSNSILIGLQTELAEKLGKISGYDDYALFLCNSGAEANENALKLASFHTQRNKIISFTGAFHGRTSLAVAATDNPSIIAPVNRTDQIKFLPFNDTEAIEKEINETLAAVIVEGIQGVGGVRVASVPFLQKLETLCKKNGVVLILDEIQSGYGRSGKFFAHQYAGIRPDIITTAKGMGNGFPIGGVLISPGFTAKKEMLGTTFGGNHLACAAGIAVLDILDRENLIPHALEMGNYLKNALTGISGIKEIRGTGLMIGIELNGPIAALRSKLLNQYLIFTGTSNNKNTLRLLPSLTITKQELDIFISAFKNILNEQI